MKPCFLFKLDAALKPSPFTALPPALLLLCLILLTACEQPAGAGNSGAQITLRDSAALAKIGVDPAYPLDGIYTLGEDLTLNNWQPVGTAAAPFTGTFDGGGRTLTINGSGGIFGFTKGAVIRNVKVAGTIVKQGGPGATVQVGGIAGHAENTAITSCVSGADMTITAHGYNSSAGGIAGFMLENSRVTNCSASGSITLLSDDEEPLYIILTAGGIAGYSGTGTAGEGASGCVISRCSYTGGTVSAKGRFPYAGGIAGYNYTGAKISECYASGNVTATGENLPYAGGIAGYNSGDAEGGSIVALIENSYAGVTVTAVSASPYALAGGITGANANNAVVSKCYALGDVTAQVTGGSGAGAGGSLGVPAAANAGGIAGAQYYESPVIEYCAALNASLAGEDSGTGAAWNIYRIAGSEEGGEAEHPRWLNNAASEEMDISLGGSPRSAVAEADGKDGADCDAAPLQAFYQTTLGWDFTAVWKMGNGYPALQWQ
jgi:hypothetical protein